MPPSVLLRPFQATYGASWLYPIKGIFYFLRHPFMYPLLRARLLPVFLLSIFVYVNLFLFTYLPQVAFLAIFHGRAAWFNATVLVLGEGAAIVGLLFEAFLCDETQVDIFDTVLVAKGFEDLVSTTRPVDPDQADPVKALGKPTVSSVYAPFSFRQIFEFIIFLPLNLIPYVGVPVFLLLTGYRAGPFHHWRLFKLRGYDKKQRNDFIKRRQLKYTWFGTIGLILQLIPIFQMFFLLTTAAGSALWAAQLEEERSLQDAAESQGPDYTDDPV
ncbi:hypothetical protein NA57DRAFT_35609 [Rhizodiscina lignyota]|uniref:Uncharacterized protein n=1 Tax=Rhizodiscina lignyota TaxID=1504668 RepID=A0A9P4INZ2_9PEZI|nr:hypothetical protein NA57DRAFT_35609 [Rhizodiscina lignyota]